MYPVQYVDSYLENATPQDMLEILCNTPVDEFSDVFLYAVEKKKLVNNGNDIYNVLTKMEHLRLAVEHAVVDLDEGLQHLKSLKQKQYAIESYFAAFTEKLSK